MHNEELGIGNKESEARHVDLYLFKVINYYSNKLSSMYEGMCKLGSFIKRFPFILITIGK